MYFTRKLLNKLYNSYEKVSYSLSYKGRSILPCLIIFNITNKCNLRCIMCPYYGPNGIKPDISKEIDYNGLKKIIYDIKKAYSFYPFLPRLGFIGGEVFLKKDLFKFLKLVTKLGFKFGITTNFSTVTKEEIKELLHLKPIDIRVSLDGPEKINDKIRNVPKLFSKIVKNIEYLRSIKSYSKQRVRINCVMLEYNVDHLIEMINLAKKLKCDIQFQHQVFSDKQHEVDHKNQTVNLFEEDLTRFIGGQDVMIKDTVKFRKIIKNINKIKESEKEIKINFLPDLKDNEIEPYYHDLENYTHSERCYFPWGTARIDTLGNIYPCMRLIYGNVLDSSFKDVWNNDKARKFRMALKKKKLFPNCIRCCKI